jgi:serine/threonine protein phosphatase PrpC
MILRAFGASDIGLLRQQNEDSFLVDNDRAVFAVADGIGGMPGGEVASGAAIAALRSEIEARPEVALADLEALAQKAHAAVRAAGRPFGPDGIGTTLTLAHVAQGRANLAHVGDSFAMIVRDGTCRAVTREHNVENERTEIFSLSPYPSGYRYALTRSVGQPDPLQVDVLDAVLHAGDWLLLATDGLTDLVEMDAIAALCAKFAEPATLVPALIREACANGGHDNITVIAIRVDEP